MGILVRGVTREQINRGLVIAKPSSLTCNSVIEANIYVLKTEEGGRVNPFTSGYRPQLYFKTADTAAEIALPDGVKIAKPGDNLTIKAKLNFPITIQKGSRFALREGGKTIAAGIVTEVLPETTELDFGKPKKVKASTTPTPAATQAPPAGKPGDKTAAKPGAKAADPKTAAKPAAGGKTPPPAGKTPPPAGKTPPPAAGKTPPPPAAGKTPPPPPPAGKAPPPPPTKPAIKTPPPPPAGKTPPPPPAGKAPTPPPPPKPPAKPTTPPPKSPPKK